MYLCVFEVLDLRPFPFRSELCSQNTGHPTKDGTANSHVHVHARRCGEKYSSTCAHGHGYFEKGALCVGVSVLCRNIFSKACLFASPVSASWYSTALPRHALQRSRFATCSCTVTWSVTSLNTRSALSMSFSSASL